MRIWMLAPALVGALIVVVGWLAWPQQLNPAAQSRVQSAEDDPNKAPAPPPEAEVQPASAPEDSPPEAAEILPPEDTLADFLEAIATIKSEAVAHNRLGVAQHLATELRERAAEHIELLHEEIRRADSDAGLARTDRSNILQALVLALPDDGFEPLVADIRARWMLASLSDDRRHAIDSFADKPLAERFYRGLPPADLPLAGALGHSIHYALGYQDVDRTRRLLDAVFGPFLASAGEGFSEVEFSDIWLSEVVRRLDFPAEFRVETTWPLAEQSLRAVALNSEFTERLRYQARMIALPSSVSITEVLAEIEAATSPFEAGKALSQFLEHSTLTPDELLQVLVAIRAATFPVTRQDSHYVYDAMFRQTDRLSNEAALISLANVALDALQRDNLSHMDYWDLSRLLTSVGNRRSILLAELRDRTGSTQIAPMYSGPDTARAIVAIRNMIAAVADEGAQYVDSDVRNQTYRSIMAGQIAGDIVQLDVTGPERIGLMRELLTAIGGTTLSIARVVMRHAYVQQDRSMRGGSFADYWSGMLRLFLEMHSPEEPLRPKSDNPAARMDANGPRFLWYLRLLHEETPSVVLTPAESGVLRQVMIRTAQTIETFPSMWGAEEGTKAIEYLKQSSLLTD